MGSIAPPHHTTGSSSYTDDWITPQWLVDRLGSFDLDPCSCDPQPWPCAMTNWTIHDDGLSKGWFGLVWCNPPYGKNTSTWLKRLRDHGNGIALIFARTETRMFFDSVWGRATGLLFLRGRLTFNRPDGTMATVLVGYGEEAYRRLAACRDLGALAEEP